jgi:hypothetical protein
MRFNLNNLWRLTDNEMFKIAKRSPCQYKVAAFGFDRKGNCIGFATNLSRFAKVGGSIHAEINLLRKVDISKLRYVLVVRSSDTGLPSRIEVCPSCKKVLNKLGIKILKP